MQTRISGVLDNLAPTTSNWLTTQVARNVCDILPTGASPLMNGKQLVNALHEGTRVYGTAILSTSPHWPEAVRTSGVDFVFIDTEHIPIERNTLSWMCRTYRALNLAPVVRIPAPDPYQAAMVLDGGASGVLAPYIETPEQVRALRGAVKFRPLKGRVLEQALAGAD